MSAILPSPDHPTCIGAGYNRYMSYGKNLTKTFIFRSSQILAGYHGEYDATLLVNCLTGMLVVPREKLFKLIPESAVDVGWGINPHQIRFGTWRRTRNGNKVT